MKETRATKAVHIAGDQVAQHAGTDREWGTQVWLANGALTGASLALAHVTVKPHHAAEAHKHANADEVIYAIKSQVTVHVGPETFRLNAGDALTIPGGLTHRIENLGADDAEMILCYSTGHRDYVSESGASAGY
jgi:mannose-6-phosphate isomerase-like protein (cupin superfamily)